MGQWTGDGKEHSSTVPPKNIKGWHRPDKDINYWFRWEGLDPKYVEDHIKLWKKHTNLPVYDKINASEEFDRFLYSKPESKFDLISEYAISSPGKQDIDDALVRSSEFKRISKPKDKAPFGFGTERR